MSFQGSYSNLFKRCLILLVLLGYGPVLFISSVHAQQPDLTIVGIGVSPPSPRADQAIVLYAAIRNQGDAAANNFYITVFIDYAEITAGPYSFDAGESEQLYTQRLTMSEGYHQVVWIVDSTNVVAESNENNNQASMTFYVAPALPKTYVFTINVSGFPSTVSTNVKVDGTPGGALKGGESQTFKFAIGSSHTISLDEYVAGTEGTRYYCSSNTWSFSSEGSYTFNYIAQHYLTVAVNPSELPKLSGEGWYDEGASVTTGTATPVIPSGSDTQYVFKTWLVDGTAKLGNPVTIVMDAPHTVTAEYKTQYKLTVNSQYGTTGGSGWYDAGGTAEFSVTSSVPESGIMGSLGVKYLFKSWTGDSSATTPQAAVLMDSPKTVTALWTKDYTQFYTIIGAIAAIIVALIVVLIVVLRRKPKAPPAAYQPPSAPPLPAQPLEKAAARYCMYCGAEVTSDATYCPKCGQQQIL
jgi:hypothetical protein